MSPRDVKKMLHELHAHLPLLSQGAEVSLLGCECRSFLQTPWQQSGDCLWCRWRPCGFSHRIDDWPTRLQRIATCRNMQHMSQPYISQLFSLWKVTSYEYCYCPVIHGLDENTTVNCIRSSSWNKINVSNSTAKFTWSSAQAFKETKWTYAMRRCICKSCSCMPRSDTCAKFSKTHKWNGNLQAQQYKALHAW